jgi:hypothetical protein
MKLLHLTFHLGCELDIEYVFKKLGHEITAMKFDDGITDPNSTPYVQTKMYEVTHKRAQDCWEKYKDYFNTFDGIITSDTCPTSRTFLQNNWSKLLIIWVCNRFDYSIQPEFLDPEFYTLLRSIKDRKNVYIFGNTFIENIYSVNVKNVDIGNFVIKPLGKNKISEFMYKTYSHDEPDVFYVPPYQNETVLLNLSEKLESLGIENKCEKFKDHISELLGYKGVICIPYAWSTIVFFERLQLGLVTFIPTERFLIQLFREGKYWFQPPFSIDHPELLQISEWYTSEHRDLMVYFDSWDDLTMKIKNTNYQEKTKTILNYAKLHEKETLDRWNHVVNDYLRTTQLQSINQSSNLQSPFTNTEKDINVDPVVNVDPNKNYDNKVAIILTCTVNRQTKIVERIPEGQSDEKERVETYIKSIKKWLYETSLPIIVVENSGYDFSELEFEKEMFKERFELVLFNETTLQEAAYLKDNYSKGTHEVFSIYYAKCQSKLIPQSACNFIIKVTGRFYIPELENYLKQYDLSKIKALRQNRDLSCQMVGSHIDQFNFIFNKRCFYRDEYAKYENDYIEILYKDKIDSLPKETVINCPVFNIEPTTGGCGGTVTFL